MINPNATEAAGRPFRVLIPLLNQRLAPDLLTIAQALSAAQHETNPTASADEAIILGVAEVHDSSFSSARPLVRAYRTLLNYMPPTQPPTHHGIPPINVYTQVVAAHGVAQGIIEAARDTHADLIILWWKGFSHDPDHIYGRICDEVMRGAGCDVLLARIGAGGLAAVREMLLAVRGGPYAELALKVGHALMPELDATLSVMHAEGSVAALPPDAPTPWDEPFRDIEEALQGIPHRTLSSAGDTASAISEQLADHDLTLIGASGELHGHSELAQQRASTTLLISSLACTLDKTLLVAKTRGALELLRYQRPAHESTGEFEVVLGGDEGRSHSAMRPIIERWSVENSYEATEFADHARLAELKQRQGRFISLCLNLSDNPHNLPAMLRGLQVAVQEHVPLVDEIIVLDGSTEGQAAAAARQHGFRAYRQDEILPEISTYAGPGSLLWKSVACTEGDLLVYLDVRSWKVISGSVAGLLGPLLEESGLQMVVGGAARHGGDNPADWSLEALAEAIKGGRSEAIAGVCARFFPALAGLTEPNSYDIAIYRRTIERMPIVAGPWAAVGMLLEVIRSHELKGLGQVELPRPLLEDGQHLAHKTLGLLSLMGRYLRSGTYRTARGRSVSLSEVAQLYQMIGGPRGANHRRIAYDVELRELETLELPPLIRLPQYLARRGSGGMGLASPLLLPNPDSTDLL